METRLDEIAPKVYRISTYIPEAGMAFNQFLIDADEPLLFHTGMRVLFPSVSAAVSRVLPPSRLRWIMFGHFEADECGAMNEWLEIAPAASVAHGAIGVMVSINDQAIRPARPMQAGETIDLGGKLIRYIPTPHVPHGWDAGLIYEETTRTLFAGDLFTATGKLEPVTGKDILEPALRAEERFKATALTPQTAPTIRSLADLQPSTLALMHAPAFTGDAACALRDLAGAYAQQLQAAN